MIIKNFDAEKLSDYAKFCRLNMGLDIMPDFLFKEKTIDDFDFDPSLTLVAYDDNGEKIVGFLQSVIRERKEGPMGYIKLLAVDSENRVKGIGTELLKKVEKNMKKRGVKVVRVYESYPNYFMPGVDPFYTEAVCFFERNGYKKFGDTSNLICDLTLIQFDTDDEERALSDDEIIIKRAEESDKEAVFDWLEKNFAAWRWEVTAAFQNNPISLHIALIKNRVFAFSAYEGNNIGTGWFGPMGTDPKFRGKKVGSILLKKCLKDMKKLGFSKAIIPWVGPIPFYMRHCNSKVQRVFWRYEKTL